MKARLELFGAAGLKGGFLEPLLRRETVEDLAPKNH
jgi:hypothetical protein